MGALTLLWLLCGPNASAAEASDSASVLALSGDWLWQESAEQRAAIAAGLESTLAAFNLFVRPIARMQLAPVAVPFERVELRLADGEVTFVDHLEERVQRCTRLIGSRRVEGVTEQGAAMWASTLVTEAGLLRLEETAQGGRRVHYAVNEAGQLSMAVAFFSDQLTRPLSYTLTYERR